MKRAKGERVDWSGMEPHYRANRLTLRELGSMYGVTPAAILKHARKPENAPLWVRDLSEAIEARAAQLVNEAVNKNLETVNSPERKASTAMVVNGTAEVIAAVRMGQRTRFSRATSLYTRLFEDLEAQVQERTNLTELIKRFEGEVNDEGLGKLLGKAMRDAIALPEQIKAFKDLATIGAQLTQQETVAYKLEKAPEGGEGGRTDLPVRFVETKWIEKPAEEGED